MHRPRFFLRPWFFISLCLSSALFAGDEEGALIVPVEAGIHRVQIEVWDVVLGEWVPYSIAHLDGQAGTVKMRFPAETPQSGWRVRATTNELIPKAWIDDESTLNTASVVESNRSLSRGGASDVFTNTTAGDAETGGGTEVVESDLWKLDGTDLYFFNQLRGLQVFDLSDPAAPGLTASLRYPARGDQMYQLNEDYLLLLARGTNETVVELVRINDGAPYIAQSIGGLAGYYQESRLIGQRLYVVTYDHRSIEVGGVTEWKGFIHINGIDFSDPAAPVELAELTMEIAQSWGTTVTATSDTLIISARNYVYENDEGEWWERGWHLRSDVYLIDLDTVDGAPRLRAHAPLAGYVSDKFKLRLEGDVLTAISEARGYRIETYTEEIVTSPDPLFDERDPSGAVEPIIETVTRTRRVWYNNTVLENLILEGDTLTSVGSIELAEGERLRATRFDGDRAYIVTFEQVDPLFIIDLSDPAAPGILGELVIPGWSNYLEVLDNGNLFSVGVEDRRVALSLFDVADPQNILLLSRVYLGDEGNASWSEANYDEKALSIFPDEGLALIPYQTYNYDSGIYRYDLALQVVEMEDDRLTLRGSLEHEAQARRASLLGNDALVSISNEELITASISDPDSPTVLADLTLAWNVDNVFYFNDYLIQIDSSGWVQDVLGDGSVQDVSQPVVRVSSSDHPDTVTTEVPLQAGNITGMTMKGSLLYLLYLDHYRNYTAKTVSLSQFRMEVYDFSDPSAPTKGATSTFPVELPYDHYYGRNSLKAVWKDSVTLVWMPQETNNYSYGPWYDYGWDFADMRVGFGFPLYDVWQPYVSSEAFIVAVDTSFTTAPKISDVLDLSREVDNGSVTYSEAYLVGDTVYLSESYHWWERFEKDVNGEQPWSGYRYENHYENHLLTVDVTPTNLLRESFRGDIVGTLTGVVSMDEGAGIVITRERALPDAWTSENDERTTLYAHLFDGAQLLPIDTYSFAPDPAYSVSMLSFAFADRVIYRAGSGNTTPTDPDDAIDRVEFGYSGEFESLPALAVAKAYSTRIDLVADHLLARSDAMTRLWSISGRDAALVGDFDPSTNHSWWGWSPNTLGDPTLIPGVALWLPAGIYGVDAFPLDNVVSSIAHSSEQVTTAIWETISSSLCLESTLSADDLVGAISNLRWRFKAADFSTVDASAADLGDYWYQSSWYGYYHQRGDEKWIYHIDHGWLWTTGLKGKRAWTYDSELGWCWVGEEAYPFVYSAGKTSWLYYYKDEAGAGVRWFYQMTGAPVGEEWFSVPQS